MASTTKSQECFVALRKIFKFDDYKSGLQAQAVKKIATGKGLFENEMEGDFFSKGF